MCGDEIFDDAELTRLWQLRGHLGVGALVSRGLETYGKDPVTVNNVIDLMPFNLYAVQYGVKKYLTVEGCTF